MLPYLTRDLPGIGGVLRLRPDDFLVEELPLYEPCGEGEHVYFQIQKTGISTPLALKLIANALGINQRDIGYAGLKDTHAVTRQTLSIALVDPQEVSALKIPGIEVLWVDRHRNKLRLGHLAGNRFVIRIREVSATDVVKLTPIVAELQRRGMPNYFGEQRFGHRGDNDKLGAALVRHDHKRLMHLLLGNPQRGLDDDRAYQARQAFDAGDLDKSMHLWPHSSGMERRALARLIKTGKPSQALRALDVNLARFWVSALQSAVFNTVLAERIDTLDKVMAGDWAQKLENGACFPVVDPAVEQPRCDAWEISPTGPILGYRTSLAEGASGEIEQRAFAGYELTPAMFRENPNLRAKGTRRALRVRPTDVSLSGAADADSGHCITVTFSLPAGSYATVFLRELMKNDAEPADDAPRDTGHQDGDGSHEADTPEHADD